MAPAQVLVTGMACRFPGAADLSTFLSLMRSGADGISDFPGDRWDPGILCGETGEIAKPRRGGYISGVREFDADFFGVSETEAQYMDPQQRLLLEMSWCALEDSGICPSEISGSDTGVFIGSMSTDYLVLNSGDISRITLFSGTGNGLALLSNRLSYFYNITGPSLTVDTACSASLSALALAFRSMQSGEISRAIVGGVNLMLHPGLDAFYQTAGLLSKTGVCSSFDKNADGIVRGEGCGAVILERADGVPVKRSARSYARIEGVATSHNGRTNGITAPSRKVQASMVRSVLAGTLAIPV